MQKLENNCLWSTLIISIYTEIFSCKNYKNCLPSTSIILSYRETGFQEKNRKKCLLSTPVIWSYLETGFVIKQLIYFWKKKTWVIHFWRLSLFPKANYYKSAMKFKICRLLFWEFRLPEWKVRIHYSKNTVASSMKKLSMKRWPHAK